MGARLACNQNAAIFDDFWQSRTPTYYTYFKREFGKKGVNIGVLAGFVLLLSGIEIGYKIASHFAKKSDDAKKNAEILGLMVNEPHITPEELGKLKMPVLGIAGTRDMVKDEHTRLIANSIPNARLVLLKGDHFIAAKKPQEFNRAVDEFLSE